MRKRGPALLGSMVLALAVACSSSQQVRPPRTPPRIPVQDGMSFTGWSHRAFEGKPAAKSLANLADIGAGWVAIVPTWYQARITSTDIHPLHKTPTYRGLVHAIRTAHELGLRVMLKPHLDLSMDPPYDRPLIGTEWRHPAEWDRWFASYGRFIFHFADIAQAEGVEQFAVGTELVGTTGQEARWRELVAGVRDRFTGTLTYASLIDGEETAIRWWDALDLIGVDVYWPLTEEFDPSLDELKDAWVPKVARFADLSARWGKPIVFTELGYRSIDGANTNPWNWMWKRPIDLQEQADCYRAALESVWDQPWFAGVYWWDWSAAPQVGGIEDAGFTPHGKPAEDVLRSWY